MINSSSFFPIRVGYGFDIHRLESKTNNLQRFLIGGTQIESDMYPVGKTDADVVLHALTDAILGALAQPTMGELFDDGDRRKGSVESEIYLLEAISICQQLGWNIGNVDMTIILEYPKLNNQKLEIRQSVANLLACNVENISIKLKTNESLGDLGSGFAIQANVCILIYHVSTNGKIDL